MPPEKKEKVQNAKAQEKLKSREAMTSKNKLQHTQAEAKWVANMPPEQKIKCRMLRQKQSKWHLKLQNKQHNSKDIML